MKKILVIGQAPPHPSVIQKVPYDSTMLYEMLWWVGISMEQAQQMFEFEAMTNRFPGRNAKNGHLVPTQHEMSRHYQNVLIEKIRPVNKIILLGKVAESFFFGGNHRPIFFPDKTYLCLPHPSRRNYALIMGQKEIIINKLQYFLHQ